MATRTEHDFPLATQEYLPADGIGSPDGDAGRVDHGVDDAAGAAGEDTGGMYLPQGALIAIIVVAAVFVIIGGESPSPPPPLRAIADMVLQVSTAVLFYVAKKREWKMREKFRQSARKVVNALTPRRSEFPKEVKEGPIRGGKRGIRLDDVPPTPRLRPEDVEKGLAVNISSKGGHKKKWGRQ